MNTLSEYVTLKEWARLHDASPRYARHIASLHRLCPAIRLPNGVTLVHREARNVRFARNATPPAPTPFPEGTADLREWAERHRLTREQAHQSLALEPDRKLRDFGSFTLVRDSAPPPGLPPAPQRVPETPVIPAFPTHRERDALVLQFRKEGKGHAWIAAQLGISRQRAFQIAERAVRQDKARINREHLLDAASSPS